MIKRRSREQVQQDMPVAIEKLRDAAFHTAIDPALESNMLASARARLAELEAEERLRAQRVIPNGVLAMCGVGDGSAPWRLAELHPRHEITEDSEFGQEDAATFKRRTVKPSTRGTRTVSVLAAGLTGLLVSLGLTLLAPIAKEGADPRPATPASPLEGRGPESAPTASALDLFDMHTP